LSLAITFGAYLVGASVGSAVHRGGPRLRRGWPVYLRLQLVATAALLGLVSAFGPPAFNPPQQAVLYGYRSGVVMISARWGWVFLPVGLVLAVLIR